MPDLNELAARHEQKAIACAKAALSTEPWHSGRNVDTQNAANHFAVAAHLRAMAESEARDG